MKSRKCYNTYVKNSKFRLAEQGKQSNALVLVLGLIVYILIGLLNNATSEFVSILKGGLPMKTKVQKVFIVCSKSMLISVWTMGANLLAGALLA